MIGVALVAGAAHADPSAEFAREYQAGVDAYRLGKLDEAKEHLEKAKAMDGKLPGPHRFLAAVAQSEKNWDACIAEARTALQLNPLSADLADTRKLHDECRAGANRPPYNGEIAEGGAIAVVTSVPGASVKINNLGFGGTPILPRPILPGTVDIVIEKQGWKPVHLTDVVVIPGIVTDVLVDLEPDAAVVTHPEPDPNAHPDKPPPSTGFVVAPANTTTTLDGEAITGKVERPPGTYVMEVRAPGKDPWRRRITLRVGQTNAPVPQLVDTDDRESTEHIGIGIVGGGLAIAAIGFACTLVAHDAAATAREINRVETQRDASIPDSTSVEPLHTRADLDSARNRADRYGLISTVAFGTAIATIGVGAIFLYRGARDDGDRAGSEPRFAIVPTPDMAGALVTTGAIRW